MIQVLRRLFTGNSCITGTVGNFGLKFWSFAIAARIEYRNCGRVVPFRKLTVPRLRDAVETVLRDPIYRQAAQVMRRNTETAGGVRRAAEIVEQAIATGMPVLNEQRLDAPATHSPNAKFLAATVDATTRLKE